MREGKPFGKGSPLSRSPLPKRFDHAGTASAYPLFVLETDPQKVSYFFEDTTLQWVKTGKSAGQRGHTRAKIGKLAAPQVLSHLLEPLLVVAGGGWQRFREQKSPAGSRAEGTIARGIRRGGFPWC